MGGGGSDNPQYTPVNNDPNDIAAFSKTQLGQKYKPEDIQQLYKSYSVRQGPNGLPGVSDMGDGRWVPTNEAMAAEFADWIKSNQQTKQNWQNYADTVNSNQGGEGDSTVTSGDAQSQRAALLGTLANPNNPTVPTPGLGSFGMIKRNEVVKK